MARQRHEGGKLLLSVKTTGQDTAKAAEDQLLELFVHHEDPEPQRRALCITLWLALAMLLTVFPESSRGVLEAADPVYPVDHPFVPPEWTPPPPEPLRPVTIKRPWLPDPTPRDVEPVTETPPEPDTPRFASQPRLRRGSSRRPPAHWDTQPVVVGSPNLVNPQLIEGTATPPHYPPCARRMGLGGTVILRAVIDKEGNVTNVRVLKGIVRCRLDELAIESALRRKYIPGRLEGRPVDVLITFRMTFTLH